MMNAAPLPPLRRFRFWLASLIFAVSDALESLGVRWNEMDDVLRAAIEEPPEEHGLREARGRYAVMRMLERQRHPCPDCSGRGWIRVPDDWEPCLSCRTAGIDPAWKRD